MSAPPGTIFVLGSGGGYAVPPRQFTLHFGRADGDVHVAIGANDPYVSRQHGMLICDGQDWWVQNNGRLPIQLTDGILLLSGNDTSIAPGYTPMTISSPRNRTHVLEVRITGFDTTSGTALPTARTKPVGLYQLSRTEHLALIALAQNYLRQDRYPQPLSWKQTATALNQLPGQKQWTAKSVEHVVAALRQRLAHADVPIRGILRDDEISEPVGNTLSHNLIVALLKSTTLMPDDLALLGEPH